MLGPSKFSQEQLLQIQDYQKPQASQDQVTASGAIDLDIQQVQHASSGDTTGDTNPAISSGVETNKRI